MAELNKQIAKVFHEIADLLELQGESVFRIRAYRQAATTLEGYKDIKNMSEEELEEIPGIGKDLASKIIEYRKKKSLEFLERKRREVPAGMREMLDIPGVGPKTVKLFYDELKIEDIQSLEKAANNKEIMKLPGIKEKTVENILEGIDYVRSNYKERTPYKVAKEKANKILEGIIKNKEVKKIEVAGSLRRKEKTIGDLDILAISDNPEKTMKSFVNLKEVEKIIGHGVTKSSVRLKSGLQVDLRIVPKESFGAALLYFTGSKAHNIRLRKIAIKKGMKLNEYGLFDKETDENIASETEEDVYEALGLDWIKPEERKG